MSIFLQIVSSATSIWATWYSPRIVQEFETGVLADERSATVQCKDLLKNRDLELSYTSLGVFQLWSAVFQT